MDDLRRSSRTESDVPKTACLPPRDRRRFSSLAVPIVALLLGWGLWQAGRHAAHIEPATRLLSAQVRPSRAQFDLRNSSVPADEIRRGGPPKDGIPAISQPRFLDAQQADYLQPEDRVIGVMMGSEARAYPLRILDYHEVVNDRVGEVPFAVTYCPLCDSAAVFDRQTPVGVREFGVSGLLYNSNVLMYDRGGDPESLWSQAMATGVSGAGVNQRLQSLPVELTTWANWSQRHPETLVLSNKTGTRNTYRTSPYTHYFQTDQLAFPVNHKDDRLPVKSRVLGVWTSGAARAYPLSAFTDSNRHVEDEVGGLTVSLEYTPESRSLRITQAEEGVEWMYAFWFAWAAFHPETDLYRPSAATP